MLKINGLTGSHRPAGPPAGAGFVLRRCHPQSSRLDSIFESDPQTDPYRSGRAPDPGQLLGSQDPGSEGLAGQASPFPPAFHADQFLLAQPSGRLFRDLTEKCVRRGVFHSVAELQASIRNYIDEHNRHPKPYLWTAKAKDILEKVKRAWYALKASGCAKASGALASIERCLGPGSEAAPCPSD